MLCYAVDVQFLIFGGVWLMVLATGGWLALLVFNLVKIRTTPKLSATMACRFPSDAPLVSILVPARNEATRILAEAVRSMGAQDYPSVEIIVVDDRSTDGTYEILERLARTEARVRVVRGAPLPEGWKGKPWALEQARQLARGSWILATDADILYEPEALRTAMTAVFRHRLDAVTLVPNVGAGSFWTRIVMPVAAWMIALVIPLDKSNDPKSAVAFGCGGFFLVRREAHDGIGGYTAIRDEVIDDVATARLLKAKGYRLRVESGQELLHTPMYTTLGELWHGFSKNAFAGADYSLVVVARNSIANSMAVVLPMILSILGVCLWLLGVAGGGLLAAASVAAILTMAASFVPVYRAFDEPAALALFAGVANVVMVLILLNSAYSAVAGRAVNWRGQPVLLARKANNQS